MKLLCTWLSSTVLSCNVLHLCTSKKLVKSSFQPHSKKGEDLEATAQPGSPCATTIIKIQCKWEQPKTFPFALQSNLNLAFSG